MEQPKYYIMDMTSYTLVGDGMSFDEMNTFVETAIAANSKTVYVVTTDQIPIVKDCKQIRADRFTKAQREQQAQAIDSVATEA